MKTKSARARPMSPADRRRAILDATIPLLLEKGGSVTTAQVAAAAQIAEGTIFRAFPDKSALIFEAMKSAMDPARVTAAIRGISPGLPLAQCLTDAAHLLCEYFNQISRIGESLRSASMPGAARQRDVGRLIRESTAAITTALMELFERHEAELRIPPATAVAAFRGLVFASVHPMLPPRERLASAEVVGILLSGIVRPGRR
jgi:AcrR family transcriptional regulator